ncbi:MAG: hypothetical protein RLZ16_725, partial [Bacteroidota bacterium]
MKKYILFIVLTFLFFEKTNSQILAPIIVKSKTVDYKKLAQIDTVVNSYIQKNWLIGTSI